MHPPYSYLPQISNSALWCISDDWFSGIQSALMQGRLDAFLQAEQARMVRWPAPWEMEHGYVMRGEQATIPLEGVLSPYGFFGFGSTKGFQAALDHAVNNPSVQSIEVRINSPGGMVEGTREAALDLRSAGQVKPTTTRFEGMGTSGAMYIGSQSNRVTSSTTAWLGNVGVRSLLVDTSKLYSDAGISVIPLVTGKFKGIGIPGVEITEEQVGHLQGLVDDAMQVFVDDLTEARTFSPAQLESIKTGAIYTAEQAKSIGLIDTVEDVDLLSTNTGDMNMSEPVADVGAVKKFLSTLGLRVVPEATPGELVEGHTSEPAAVAPIRTYEDGVKAGIAAAREEDLEIMQLASLTNRPDALSMACAAVRKGQPPRDFREALATAIALRGSRDDEGQDIPEINTAHAQPVSKAPPTLPSAQEMAAERDRMAASYSNGRTN